MLSKISDWCQHRGISEIEAVMPDISGIARGKIMPVEKYVKSESIRLAESVLLQTVTGDFPIDDSSIHPSDRDMIAKGDANTIRIVPWAKEPTAQIIHNCYHYDETPVTTTPRYVLQNVLEAYHKAGWSPIIAPELEFYLVKPNTDADYPLEPPIGRSGRAESSRKSFGLDALTEYEELIDDIYDYCEQQAIELDTLVHEEGAAQLEINLNHGNPLELADQAFIFKRTVREVAFRHHMYATFMAKPMQREPGSAMHIHINVTDLKSGTNIFADENGKPNDTMMHFIGGLQKYTPAAMSFFCPYVNSYRRISHYWEAPINLHWGIDNRTAGLRVPYSEGQALRIENRVPGADCNPYLAIAATMACGFLGIKEQIQPTAPIEGKAADHDDPAIMPRNLIEALDQLNKTQPLIQLMGEQFVNSFNAVKMTEHNNFLNVISSWEREHLLLNV